MKLPHLVLFAIFTASALAADPVPVTVRPLAELAVYPEQRAPAEVISQNDSRVSAEISARIVEIPVLVGQVVEQGALLARLESTDYELALRRELAAAESLAARIDLARYQLERAQSLAVKEAVSDELLKQREAELKTLLAEQKGRQAALEQAQRNVEKTSLRAPFRAVVAERLGQVGELASPGTPLLRIVDAERIEVSAKVQANHAESLSSAERVELTGASGRHALQLRTITPAIDSRSRTREARLTFSGPAALPGAAGEVIWRNHRAHIPADLVLRRDGRLGFFQMVDGQARFTVLAGAEEGRPAVTIAGPDTLLIVEGRFRLQDGDAVVGRASPTGATRQ